MASALVSNVEVPWSQVCTHWEGWNKGSSGLQAYELVFSHGEVVARFERYWSEFIERESEPTGVPVPPGVYADLQAARYPSLQGMLSNFGDLFEALVMSGLQTEFVGFLVAQPSDVSARSPAYFLQNLEHIKVAADHVRLEGQCFQVRTARG